MNDRDKENLSKMIDLVSSGFISKNVFIEHIEKFIKEKKEN